MNPLQRLRATGVSLWLDTLSRDLLDSGHLARLIADFSVTGATSNPTIFDHGRLGNTLPDSRPDEVITTLTEVGIDLERVGADLEDQGLAAFQRSYQQLLDHITSRVARLTTVRQAAGESADRPEAVRS